jgi:hypothetical protein
MAVGESQDCSWVARGWARSLFFVVFSYASKATLKTDWKLEEEEEEEAMGAVWDMVVSGIESLVRHNQATRAHAQASPGATV